MTPKSVRWFTVPRGRHQAPRTNATAYMELRARGGHTTTESGESILPRRSAHVADTAPAPLGQEDYSDELAEVRRELSRPINTQAVSA